MDIHECECTSVACNLINHGYFPCAPKAPSVAFDINMLELVSTLFLRVAPNTTAWASTLESFLGARQFKLRTRVCSTHAVCCTHPNHSLQHSIRRRFANALNWYGYLTDCVQAELSRILNIARTNIIKRALPTEHQSAIPPCDPQTDPIDHSASMSASDKPSRPTNSTSKAGSHAEGGRASSYLRSRCPLCFGGTGRHDESVT